MKKELTRSQIIEQSITSDFRKSIWIKFVQGVKEFEMIKDGDKIAVCISGGKDSMLLAKCMQELKRHRQMNFDLVFLVMDPGYNEENRQKIIDNAKTLNIPITIFNSNIFEVVEKIDDHPCYLCARMRRGHLYKKARELGCNKIALGHHFDDVIETILMGMLYGAQMQTMMPKLHSTYHKGMELIRPMYYVKEADIIEWAKVNDLHFIQCACKITQKNKIEGNGSKRDEVKSLIKDLRKKYDKIDMNIYNSTKNVNLSTVISYVKDGKTYHFLDEYDKNKSNEPKTQDSIMLKVPSEKDMRKILKFKEEFNGDIINGSNMLDMLGFDKWIKHIDDNKIKKSYTYLAINDNDVVGMIHIRPNIDEKEQEEIGHIGYSVSPKNRKKGYATKMLKAAIEKCKDLGLNEVILLCYADNIVSQKTIEKNGGVLYKKSVEEGKEIYCYKVKLNED